MQQRRTFFKKAASILTGIGMGGTVLANRPREMTTEFKKTGTDLPENPLVLFDNFHAGNRHPYSWKAKFAAAKHAGFDGFEFAVVDPTSDRWKAAMDLVPTTNFKVWGFHWTTKAVMDSQADRINEEIEKIVANVEVCGTSPLKPYFTLSLSGRGELNGPTIHERGSAMAKDRHWRRAYKIIAAFDEACQKYNVKGSLYPHIDWICDTPQSAIKIIEGAKAQTVVPAFCTHHWYANKASDDLDTVLRYPQMKNLQYVVMTNGIFHDKGFQAVRFNEGQIDMAWVLAKLFAAGYRGPISSQGWRIGGDPFMACQQFVDGMKALQQRFMKYPDLNPLID